MSKLQTNFKDDILDEEMNGKRRVKLTPLSDGTYIIEDVTKYTQTGSEYGQKEINQLNETVNGKLDSEKVIDDLNTAVAVTENGVPVGCKVISELNGNLKTANNNLAKKLESAVIQHIGSTTVTNNVPNKTETTVAKFSNLPSGIYVIMANFNFSIDVDAIYMVKIKYQNTDLNISRGNMKYGGGINPVTILSGSGEVTVTVYQESGKTATLTTVRIFAVRLK